jgi:ATP-dependent protease ClpP protease subunit
MTTKLTHTSARTGTDLIEILTGGGQQKKRSFDEKSIGSVLEFYISGSIEEASEYVDWFNKIRHAGVNDVIRLYINSCGGDLFTAIQFMRVLRETNATIVVSVEGACMSAATLLFLMADDYEISPHSIFMFHNYSGGAFGKGGEMIDQLVHERKWSLNLFTEAYKDFLTSSEITSMMDNKDIWMDAAEVVNRLNARLELRKAAEEKDTASS